MRYGRVLNTFTVVWLLILMHQQESVFMASNAESDNKGCNKSCNCSHQDSPTSCGIITSCQLITKIDHDKCAIGWPCVGASHGFETAPLGVAGTMGSVSPTNNANDSRFTQQELPAWKPILTPGWVIASFLAIALLFIPIGLFSLFASERVAEIVFRYDQLCLPAMYRDNATSYIQNSHINKTCIQHIPVAKTMKAPIFVYYQLDNFYQNHRRYVKSRSDKQLRSRDNMYSTKTCEPQAKLKNESTVVPCGLIAWSLFNDTYSVSINNKVIDISKKGIAWKSDTKDKFGSNVYPKNFQANEIIGGGKLNESIPLSEQEDLIVWMRTAALPTFRKLYGKINSDIEAHTLITVALENNYNTYSFGGQKKFVLSTTTWIGGKNDFLGIAYLTVGGISLFMALNFVLLYVFKPRPLGDPSYLSWNRNSSKQ